jgi:hypothetical protein
MADHNEHEKVWDEYDWERFLQQQDRKTERYMELLEKYIDDPNRDQIIAREMGWHHLLDDAGSHWAANVDSLFEEHGEEAGEDVPSFEAEEDDQTFETHPLYQASFALTTWIDTLFDEEADLQNHPCAVQLATQSAIANAKLAAALSDDDIDELGMTIAYLKRALKAITNAMQAAAQLKAEIGLSPERYGGLLQRIFQIRDGIITLMGKYREEWRRRYGH